MEIMGLKGKEGDRYQKKDMSRKESKRKGIRRKENKRKEIKRKEKKLKEEGNYKHYPLWDNCTAAFAKFAQKKGNRYLALMGADVILSVLQPFAAMALPSAVVYLLGSGWQPELIFLSLAGYVLAMQLMQVIQGYLAGVVQKARFLFRVNLGTEFFEAALTADFQEFESTKGQEKLEGARGNVYYGNERGIEAYLKAWEDAMIALAGLTVYTVIMGRINLWLLLLLFAVAVTIMAVNICADRRTQKYEEEYIKVNRGFEYLKREALVPASGKDIRIYKMWSWFQKEFKEMREELAYWSGRQRNCSINASIFEKVLSAGRNLLVYGYLIYQMAQGKMDLAAFLLYVGIVASFGSWMNSLTGALTEIMFNNRYMDRYRDFLEFADMKPWKFRDKDARKLDTAGGMPQSVKNPEKPHEIRLEHVSFRYEGNEEDAVRDLTLTIKPGEKIALVGMNGAGKSTLIKLICGLYRPTSGAVYLDGQNAAGLSQEEYRKEFAVVFQEVFAFSFPLADNISCRPEGETDPEKLEKSLLDAGLWDRVQELPKKAQTSLNKDMDAEGVSLSGGELQKLMLARALYKDCPIVILDEPTAALDPIAESRMYDRYYEMTKDKTSIFISHRLSSTKFCSRILYMEKGRITEEGDHRVLMERNGAYAAMFHTQARYYEKENKPISGLTVG